MTFQEPKPVSPAMREAVIDGDVMRYVPIAGTHGWGDAWCSDPGSPFAVKLASEGFVAIRARDGRPFRWSTDLNGLLFWRRSRDWHAGADALFYFLDHLPYRDRNVIAHSHGGNVALLAAAGGLELRSLTTVGTPVRKDIPAADAAKNIGLWQHIYDRRWDHFQLAGQMFDGDLDFGRSFRVPGVVNIPLAGVKHTNVLRSEGFIAYWSVFGWLARIRASQAFRPTVETAS